MAKTNTPLNNKTIDAVQSLKKTYDPTLEAHRVTEISEPYNKVEYIYNDCCQILTATYYYDCAAEVSQVCLNADSCSSLCSKSFLMFSAQDSRQYRIIYSVSCGATIPTDTPTIKFIGVGILACDSDLVIALATKLALEANVCAAADFSVTRTCAKLVITNSAKGTATDIVDNDTGFTFTTNTNGTRTTVDVLTYEYDSEKRVKCITSLSGEDLFGINQIQSNQVTISGDGNIASVLNGGALLTQSTAHELYMFQDMIKQLKIMNIYLSIMNDMTVEEDEIGDE